MTHPTDGMTEDQVLLFTQKTRVKVIGQLLKDKTTGQDIVPEDGSSKTLLTAMLDGLDRQALGTKRIKADEKIGTASAASAALIAQMLMETGSRRQAEVIDMDAHKRAPQLGSDIPDPELVPGETEINAAQLDYKSFMGDAA